MRFGLGRASGALLSVVAALGLLSLLLGGCGYSAAKGSGMLDVVAAENTWGSLASQLGGPLVHVKSIISDPNADPHEYESSASDARAIAEASLVVVNGAGYDDWAAKLLSAEPSSSRRLLDVADLVHKKAGDNPHFWYNPRYVFEVVNAITADYEAIEPAKRPYFARRHALVESRLSAYRRRLGYLSDHFAGEHVAATESIFQYMADYLGLDLVSPEPFMKAVAEGTDPPASSVASFYDEIDEREFKVLVYNVQTVTPLTTSIKAAAAEKGIDVIGVSETIEPPKESFEAWMVSELDELGRALKQEVGR